MKATAKQRMDEIEAKIDELLAVKADKQIEIDTLQRDIESIEARISDLWHEYASIEDE